MRIVTDQLQNEISVPDFPKRIISLVPSQTELLFDLGLGERVVGITKFCLHPASWRASKTIIGGTKRFDFEAIHNLKPDLIIGNKEENYEEGIRQLSQHYPVWMSDIISLSDACGMIEQIGEITNTQRKAIDIVNGIAALHNDLPDFYGRRVLYLIWRNPWMAAGGDTFINSMLNAVGLQNVVSISRYPEVDIESIKKYSPDFVFLSSEPYPFKEKHIKELQEILPSAIVVLVNGEMFSWHGSRLLLAVDYFRSLHSQLKSNAL